MAQTIPLMPLILDQLKDRDGSDIIDNIDVSNAVFKIKDGGRAVQINPRILSAQNKSSPAHLSYVPTVILEPQATPPISTLINMKSRYHLNVPSLSKINDGDVATTMTSCNLGRTILRGIVSQMEELKLNEIVSGVDRANSVKKADLPSYCEYLRREMHD